MSNAPRYIPHYTVADYLQWQGDWELWQGVPIAMTPSPFGPHQHCMSKLARALSEAIEVARCDANVLPEIDWIVSDDTVVRPDVVVICGEVPAGHVTNPPAVVVEILSPSTAGRDQTEKFELYEENGIGHYLIVDPKSRVVRCFSRSSAGKLEQVTADAQIGLSICADCELLVDLSKLW